MELVTGLLAEIVLDPVLLVATAVLSLLLLSGLPARMIEAWDSRATSWHTIQDR